jgi:hypothetical protein
MLAFGGRYIYTGIFSLVISVQHANVRYNYFIITIVVCRGDFFGYVHACIWSDICSFSKVGFWARSHAQDEHVDFAYSRPSSLNY